MKTILLNPNCVYFFFLLLCQCNRLQAQQSEKDSLLSVYRSKVPQDSSMVNLLCRLVKIYRMATPDSAIEYGKKAYLLAAKIAFEKGIANSLNLIGSAYFYKGDYPTAETYQQKALRYAEDHAMPIAKANALNSLALAYQYQGNHIAAYEAYLKALHQEEEANNYLGRIKVLTNMGILYKTQGDFDNAISYYKRALILTDSVKDPRPLKASNYNNLGVIFIEQKKFNEALKYVQQGLALNKELGNKAFVANGLANIGFCYLNMDSLVKAEQFLNEGLLLARETHYTDTQQKALTNLAQLYLKQKNPTRAMIASKESLVLARKYNSKENIFLNYQSLAQAYRQLGQNDLGYEFLEKAFRLGDSLKNTDNTSKINALQRSFELNKKQSEITLLEKDAALKKAALIEEQSIRYGLIVLIAVLCIATAVVYYSFTAKAALSKKLQLQNDEISTQKELILRINKDLKAQALRAQMNPHFIFNSLNSIQYLILQKESVKSYDYLAKFSMLLRRVMENSERDLITLAEELELLHLYLQLESLRFDSSFDYTITSTLLNSNSIKVPPLVVQPYIENAIQHGLMPKPVDRKLTIKFFSHNNSVCCEIEDNGIGRAEAKEISNKKNRLFSSRGMHYTTERIEVMNALSNGKSEVKIFDLSENTKPSGTLVRIIFAYA